jgi:hypothetical protein
MDAVRFEQYLKSGSARLERLGRPRAELDCSVSPWQSLDAELVREGVTVALVQVILLQGSVEKR